MFTVSRKHFDLGERTLKYIELEYIESTGTLYILTPICIFSKNSIIKVDILLCNDFTSSSDEKMFGNDKLFGIVPYNSQWRTVVNSNILWATINCLNNRRVKYIVTNSNIKIYNINEIELYSLNVTIPNVSVQLVCFGNYSDNGTRITKGKTIIHSIQFIENNIKVLDIIPVKDSSGVVCMYDKVSKTFFYNQGTGNFIAGPVVREVYNDKTKFLVSREHSETIFLPSKSENFSVSKIICPIKINVNFDANGGESVTEQLKTYVLGLKYESLPSATRYDYRMTNWYTDPLSGQIIAKNDIVRYDVSTLYAHYVQKIGLTFNADGGTFPGGGSTKVLKYAPGYPLSDYTMPDDPTLSDYNFKGWFTGLSGTGTEIKGSSICPVTSLEYFAKWSQSKGTVYYCGNYGDFHETGDIIGNVIDGSITDRVVTVQFNGSEHIEGFSEQVSFDFNLQEISLGYGYDWEEYGTGTVNWYSVQEYGFDIYIKITDS